MGTFLALLAVPCALFAGSADWGVLVLAHGGKPEWDAAVRRAVRRAELPRATEVAFGMAAMPGEVQGMAEALGRLKKRGARRVVVVPFLVSSYSEVYRQYQYVLNMSPSPGFTELEIQLMHSMHSAGAHHGTPMGPVFPLRTGTTPLFLTRALDDSLELSEVLRDRAREVSRDPAREHAVLIAHGPVGDEDNVKWMEALDNLKLRLAEDVPFAGISVVSLRDDAPAPVRDAATKGLRALVEAAARRGETAVVLPVLISAGGIERGVAARLEGLEHRMGKPLLPHPALSRWIARKAAEVMDGR